MARIRSIKPEFWTSEQVMNCGPLTRLLFIGMWNFADDYGRMPYSPSQIKAQVMPNDNMELQLIKNMLAELSGQGLILIYSAKGREYIEITGWSHQKIDKRQAPKYPGPSSDYDLPDEPPNSDESPRPPPTSDAGVERKGIDMEDKNSAPSAAKEKSRKRPATSLPDDWLPSNSSKEKAKELGLSDAEIGREAEKFKNHARQNDRRVVLWDSAFDNWCINAAQYLGKQPKTQNLSAWRAMPGDPEFLAWKAYAKDSGKGALTRLLDQRELEGRGFDFESRWPPGHKVAA